jgi:hypothetical protein
MCLQLNQHSTRRALDGRALHGPGTSRLYVVRPTRSIFNNALNFRCSAIAAFVRSP